MAKTSITITATPAGGYVVNVAGRYGGGYRAHAKTAQEAADRLADAIARYLDTNPEGGDITAPPEVGQALEANRHEIAPGKGARLSYYASPAALQAIQAERETTGDSQSGAINSLVLRGANIKE